MIDVMLVDDDHFVRIAVGLLLKQNHDIRLLGQTSDGSKVLPLYRELQPDVIVLDLQLPEKNGLIISRELLREFPNAKIVILSAYLNDVFLGTLRDMGILGFVKKGTEGTEGHDLIEAIQSVSRNEVYFCAESTNMLMKQKKKESAFSRLTKQEIQVILLLAYNMSIENIARAFNVEAKTIYTHKRNAFKKLHIRSLEKLFALAMQHGFYVSQSAG